MAKITVKDLMEAGVHFGHQTKRWNPKMKHYVYGAKNGISIIDITKTMRQLADACNFLQHKVAEGKDVLFVGTKRQAQQIIRESAEKTGMYHVSERWLGGTLTNNVTIRKSISKMYEIDKTLESEEAKSLKKKELAALTRNSRKLHRDLDGIADMKKLPGVLVIVDVCHDDIAVREANKLNIPIVAIVDTNGDPEPIDFPIAANDDAVKSVKLIIDVLGDSVMLAKEIHDKRVLEEKVAEEAEKAKREKEKATAKKDADGDDDEDSDGKKSKRSSARKSTAKKPASKKVSKTTDDDIEPPKAKTGKVAKETPAKEEKAEVVETAEDAPVKEETAKAVETTEETPAEEEKAEAAE